MLSFMIIEIIRFKTCRMCKTSKNQNTHKVRYVFNFSSRGKEIMISIGLFLGYSYVGSFTEKKAALFLHYITSKCMAFWEEAKVVYTS